MGAGEGKHSCAASYQDKTGCMVDYSVVESRYAFALPELYKQMSQDGCFDRHAQHYLQFTDMQWLETEGMLSWVFDKHLIDGLIPFAETLSGNLWAWYPQLDARNPQAVVHIPDEDEVAVLYAPDFCSAVYRMMLEELTNTFLVERGDEKTAIETLQLFTQTLAAYFPAQWNERLAQCITRPLQATQENFYGVISEQELEEILQTDIAYDRLDEEFSCVQEDAAE